MARKAGPGRPRQPIERKILEGTYRADRDGPLTTDDLPEPPPPKPASLTGPAAEVWDEILPLLAGIVKRRDVPALADLCRWIARMQRIAGTVDTLDVTDKKFVSTLTAAGIATTNFERYCGKFGLTPSDRAKLRIEQAGPVRAKVATRPRTKLDAQGPPK